MAEERRLVVADSSAWVEFIRGTGSPANLAMRELMAEPDRLTTTEPVIMEVLAGARSAAHMDALRSMLARCRMEHVAGLPDYDRAAVIHASCRRAGDAVGSMLDCLIAAVAIRLDAAVLHRDRDFKRIARHTTLRLAA